MAKKSKFAFRFEEMESLADRIQNAGGSLQKAADKALHDTHDMITPKLSTGIARHVDTGSTQGSLVKAPKVEWLTPTKAQVNIGFDLSEGWPSIFLMWGTPKMAPDTALKNAAFAPSVARQAKEIQKAALEEFLRDLAGG